MEKTNLKKLIYHIAVAELVGVLSSVLSGNTSGIYKLLIKPPFSPPRWIFGIVWPILFAFMGYAVYLVSDSWSDDKAKALKLYRIQLFLNFLWPIIFFRFNLFFIALAEIILLDYFVYQMWKVFKGINPKSGNLILPYLLWILYATYLTAGFMLLN